MGYSDCKRKNCLVLDIQPTHEDTPYPISRITLWYFNIAMEHGPFIGDLPIQIVIFHSYVKLPEGTLWCHQTWLAGKSPTSGGFDMENH